MVKRQTWIFLAVFAILIGFAFLWTRYQDDKRKSQPTLTPTPEQFLFNIDSAAVASLKITDIVNGNKVMVARDVSGQWTLVDPQAEYTDIASVEAALTQLASLRVITSIDTMDNMAEYGLDQPTYRIVVNINGGQQYVAQVGSLTVTGSGYYVLDPSGVPKIIAKYSLDSVLKLLSNPPIATPTLIPSIPTLEATIPQASVTPTGTAQP